MKWTSTVPARRRLICVFIKVCVNSNFKSERRPLSFVIGVFSFDADAFPLPLPLPFDFLLFLLAVVACSSVPAASAHVSMSLPCSVLVRCFFSSFLESLPKVFDLGRERSSVAACFGIRFGCFRLSSLGSSPAPSAPIAKLASKVPNSNSTILAILEKCNGYGFRC